MVAKKFHVPERGEIGWLTFRPQVGREQAGRRLAICLSPASYNRKSGMAIFCPITSRRKGYPFEVEVITDRGVDGVVLADQVRSLDYRGRDFDYYDVAPDEVLERASTLVKTLIG